MAGPIECPNAETLASFVFGKLPPEQGDVVHVHVGQCAACVARVRAIEQQSDAVIAARRQPNAQAVVAATQQLPVAPLAPATPGRAPGSAAFLIDGFDILAEIGRGGMGVVYRAQQQRLDRLVAIKMILAGHLAGEEQRVRFLLEGSLLARLNHPNFVQVHQVGTVELSPGILQPYLVLEYIDGVSLKTEIGGKALAFEDAARLVLTLARAMEQAHAQGIVHRDLKPANVLIARDGTLKICDFGLAKELSPDASLTPTGMAVGTPNYMAPEQVTGKADVGPAADVYALGAILYELLTGRPPFPDSTPMQVLLQVLQEAPTPTRRLRPGVPRDLEVICQKCLEKEPRARYARAADLANDLQAWLEHRPIQARPAGKVERGLKWCRRHPLTASLVIFLVLSLLLGSAASTYFGVTAMRHAHDLREALDKEAEAREAFNRQGAEVQLIGGKHLAAAGEVDRGMFLMQRALERAPASDPALRQVIQRDLEAWLPYLPRLRWYRSLRSDGQAVVLEKEVLHWQGNRLFVTDGVTGSPLEPPQEFPGAGIVACSPTGQWVCTSTFNADVHTLRVFERRGGRLAGEPIADDRPRQRGLKPNQYVYSIAFSSDGALLIRTLATADNSERQAWNIAAGKPVGPPLLRGKAPAVHLLRAPAGRACWVVFDESGKLEVVDTRNGAPVGSGIDSLPDDVERPPELFPRRHILQSLFGRLDGTFVALWDLERAAPLLSPRRQPANQSAQQVSQGGLRLAHRMSNQRSGWHDLATQQPQLPTASVGAAGGVWPAEHGLSCVVTASGRDWLKRIDFPRLLPPRSVGSLDDVSVPFSTARPRTIFGMDAEFSPDRQVAVLGETNRAHREPYARLASTADNRPLGRPITDCDSRATFSPSGKLVAFCSSDVTPSDKYTGLVRVYAARTGEPHGAAFNIRPFAHTLVFSPDERLLVVGHVFGAELCDLATGKSVSMDQPGPVNHVLFSRDGRRVALAGRAGWQRSRPGVRVWDVATGKPVGETVAMRDSPLLVATPDGDGFYTIDLSEGWLRRWDFAAAAVVEDFGALGDWPSVGRRRSAWTIDTNRLRLAVGTVQGLIYQWDLKTGRRVAPPGDIEETVRRLAYAPDGRWLAAVGDEGSVALLDPATGRRAGPLLAHRGPLLGMAFTPDTRALLTVDREGRCRRWDLGAPQALSAAEWQTWLEAATGLSFDGETLVPLSVADHEPRVADAAALPLPLTLPPVAAAHWHEEEAFDAERAGQRNAARWHLDRWVALEPTAWLPFARRARIHALEGSTAAADADLKRAAALCPDDGLANWQRHQAVVDRLGLRKK